MKYLLSGNYLKIAGIGIFHIEKFKKRRGRKMKNESELETNHMQ